MEILKDIWVFLNKPFMRLGDVPVSLFGVLIVIVLTVMLFLISRHVRKWLARKGLARFVKEPGSRETVATLMYYLFIVLGLLIILQTAGVQISSIMVVLGTVGIGLGLGLQPVVNSFISGILVLFEEPFKVGDEIKVGTAVGEVTHIGMRATTLLSLDNIVTTVPNSDLTTLPITNWSANGKHVRLNIRVVAAYGADPAFIRDLLLKIAGEHESVLSDPAPTVALRSINEGFYRFLLQVFTIRHATDPIPLSSDLYYEIIKAFREHDIALPSSTQFTRTSPEGETGFLEG